MSNDELIARLRHQRSPDNPWEKCDLRDIMEAAATALEAAELVDVRIASWNRIADHVFFSDCFDTGGTLLDAMLTKLDVPA